MPSGEIHLIMNHSRDSPSASCISNLEAGQPADYLFPDAPSPRTSGRSGRARSPFSTSSRSPPSTRGGTPTEGFEQEAARQVSFEQRRRELRVEEQKGSRRNKLLRISHRRCECGKGSGSHCLARVLHEPSLRPRVAIAIGSPPLGSPRFAGRRGHPRLRREPAQGALRDGPGRGLLEGRQTRMTVGYDGYRMVTPTSHSEGGRVTDSCFWLDGP